jgi:hypothetical protein
MASSPKYPDPKTTANEQKKLNIDTATAQSNLNHVDQYTPTGSSTYKVVGKNADGTPKYAQTTALNPEQQKLFDTQTAGAQGLAKAGVASANNLKGGSVQTDLGPNDFSSDRNAVEAALFQRLNPQLEQQELSLRTRLAGQGIKEGSEAWNHALDTANRQRNDLGLDITARGLQEQQGQQGLALNKANFANAGRNQQVGEALSLNGKPSPSLNPAQTSQSGVAPTDYSGLVNGQFNAQTAAANATNNAWGSVGSTVGGWLFSDPKLKTDVHDTGAETKDGIPLRTFRYKGSPILNMGVMADEAKEKRPDAVRKVGQHSIVNYDKLGSPMLRLGVKK